MLKSQKEQLQKPSSSPTQYGDMIQLQLLQHQTHLDTIKTLTGLYQNVDDTLLRARVVQALLILTDPFVPQSNNDELSTPTGGSSTD